MLTTFEVFVKINKGQSLKIFLSDGTSEGLRIVEVSNWVGKALACSRSEFAELKTRPEFKKAGVYIIYSTSADGTLPEIYIGEGDPVVPRLGSHAKTESWLILSKSKRHKSLRNSVSAKEPNLIIKRHRFSVAFASRITLCT